MEQKKSEFDKVLGAWDILVIAFGAMIGWGWVVSSGSWIQKGGVVGASIAFAIGGVMIFFIGLTYAELTAAMPQCGGEHVFSYKAMGPNGSFICTWAIILGYVSVTCFEACAFPTIITYLWPGFLKGYMYSVAGFDIYASWVAVAVIVAFLITLINVLGAKTAAVLQTVLTCIIGGRDRCSSARAPERCSRTSSKLLLLPRSSSSALTLSRRQQRKSTFR